MIYATNKYRAAKELFLSELAALTPFRGTLALAGGTSRFESGPGPSVS